LREKDQPAVGSFAMIVCFEYIRIAAVETAHNTTLVLRK